MERHGTICVKIAVTTLHCRIRIACNPHCRSEGVSVATNSFVHVDKTFGEEIWISGKSGRRSDANREKNSSDNA